MKVKDILSLVPDKQVIHLIMNCEWAGAFPASYCPKEYEDLVVTSAMPEHFTGESEADGVVWGVWVKTDND